jgi:parallel beta-helix repeat protein
MSVNCTLQNNTAYLSPTSEYSLGAFTLRECDSCVVSDCTARGFAIGVEIVGGEDNRVIHNTLCSTTLGVRVAGNDTYVADNGILALYSGVEIQSSTEVNIVTNNIQNILEDSHGINILAGSEISVESNYISNSGTGIRLQSSTDINLARNRIVDCVTGISIEEDPNPVQPAPQPERCNIENNILHGCGFRFDLWSPTSFNHHISGNTVNGQVMGYFFNRTDEVIDGSGFGQLILAVCESVVVTNANFVSQSTALSVQFCSDVEVSDVALFNNEVGIHIRASSQTMLSSVECSESTIGLHVQESLDVYTYRSQFNRNNYGILVEDSPGISIYGCSLSENYLPAVIIGAHGGVIESNNIENNEYGLHLLRTNQAFITGNRIRYNSETGIVLNRASDGNRIYGNQIGWNGINAICGGQDNHWDDGTSHGNLWSDLGSSQHYEIDEDDVDRYPQLLLGNSSTAASETEPVGTYSPLDDPFLTLLAAISSCGIVFCLLREMREHP